MVIQGVTGELRWSYLTAAKFGPYRLTTNADGTARLTGRVVSVDSLRVTQAPLNAVVWIGKSTQKRVVSNLQIVGETLTADLGRLESQSK